MNLDPRIPIGLLFSFIGVVLTALGGASNSTNALYEKSLGVNVNLWWGVVLLVFGQTMFHIGRRVQRRLQPSGTQQQLKAPERRKRR